MERFSQLHALLGLDADGARAEKRLGKSDILKGLGLYDAAFDALTVRPDDEDDHTPRAVLAYITRVLDIVDPIRATPRRRGREATTLPTRTAPVTPIIKTRELGHGRPRDVLHYIDTIAYALADDYAAPYTGNAPIGRTRYDLANVNDDALFNALRRAVLLRRDAPDANPDADTVPANVGDLLVNVHRDADGNVKLDDDGNAVRKTYPTGPSTKREWGNLIRPAIRSLIARGYTLDAILDRLNA